MQTSKWKLLNTLFHTGCIDSGYFDYVIAVLILWQTEDWWHKIWQGHSGNMINPVWVHNNGENNWLKQLEANFWAKIAKKQTPHGMHFSMWVIMASSWSNFRRHLGHSFWRMPADSSFFSTLPSLFADAPSSTSIPRSGSTSPPLNISSTGRLPRSVGDSIGPRARRKAAWEP